MKLTICYSTFKETCKRCLFWNVRGSFDNDNVGIFMLSLDRHEEGHFRPFATSVEITSLELSKANNRTAEYRT